MNVLKKSNGPMVDQSLEATRSIEYQLLNVKEKLEKFAGDDEIEINLAPAVSQTLETLEQINTQIENVRSLLENHHNLSNQKEQNGFDRPRQPQPDNFLPTYPPTYPRHEFHRPYPQYPPYPSDPHYPPYQPEPRYSRVPMDRRKMEQFHRRMQDYPMPYPGMDPFFFYYGTPYLPPMFYGQPYGYPQGHPQRYPASPPQQPYYSPGPEYPPQTYGEYGESDDIERYEGSKYPTVASSEPAYSEKSNAVPSNIFKIAYYPWEQLTGKRSPTSSRVPYMNLYDVGKEYIIYVELPGVEKEDLELRVDNQLIWIKGKPMMNMYSDGNPMVQEHGYHEFFRQIQLPSKIISNKTKCSFESGILKISLTKEAPKKPAHKVKIE